MNIPKQKEESLICLDVINEELNNKIERNKKIMKRIQTLEENIEFAIPTKEAFLSKNNNNNKYTIQQLKQICKHYKLKISGVKNDLIERISNFFKRDDSIYIIQRFFKKAIYKKYMRLHGPARIDRKICVNETDFYTMEPLKDIQYSQFYSFKDNDNMIYGFDILSLYTLLFKSSNITNPYNRNPFPSHVANDLKRIISISKVIKDKFVLQYGEEEVKVQVSPLKELEMATISLFQHIDQLGNYTDYKWFWSLAHRQLARFLHELNDIWNYRLQLTQETKREICPPVGNPFVGVHINMISSYMPLLELKRAALHVIEQLVKRGATVSSRCLGANYVLCALTLVSPDAAVAIPWLYQSVAHV